MMAHHHLLRRMAKTASSSSSSVSLFRAGTFGRQRRALVSSHGRFRGIATSIQTQPSVMRLARVRKNGRLQPQWLNNTIASRTTIQHAASAFFSSGPFRRNEEEEEEARRREQLELEREKRKLAEAQQQDAPQSRLGKLLVRACAREHTCRQYQDCNQQHHDDHRRPLCMYHPHHDVR